MFILGSILIAIGCSLFFGKLLAFLLIGTGLGLILEHQFGFNPMRLKEK